MKKKKIKLDKNGFPITKEQEEELRIKAEEEIQNGEESSKVNQGIARDRKETKQEKKNRKQELKKEKRLKREQKKDLKIEYQNEEIRQKNMNVGGIVNRTIIQY